MWEIVKDLFDVGVKLYSDWVAASDKEKAELEQIARARQVAGDEAEARVRAENLRLRAETDEARRKAVSEMTESGGTVHPPAPSEPTPMPPADEPTKP